MALALSMEAIAAGKPGASLVVLLHGFPDLPITWRKQVGPLAEAGYRVVAPLLPGYGGADPSEGVGPYRMDRLVDGVVDLIRREGAGRASVVGHDWGGAIAWNLPRYRPDAVERLVIVNSPHPMVLRRALRTLDQLRRSWYIFFFQLPVLPEALLRRDDFALLARLMAGALRNDPDRRALLATYRKAWGQPGALTAALNYYRALFRTKAPSAPSRIETQTLLIWGEKDPHLGVQLTEGTGPWVPNLEVERIPEAGHWAHLDAPDRVNARLLAFLRASH